MKELAIRNIHTSGLPERALNQALRELLLAQASDWPFMMKSSNTYEFASNKFKEHINNFFMLHKEITSKHINGSNLSLLENKNSIFPDINFRIYSQH